MIYEVITPSVCMCCFQNIFFQHAFQCKNPQSLQYSREHSWSFCTKLTFTGPKDFVPITWKYKWLGLYNLLCHCFHIPLPKLFPSLCYRVIEMPYAYQCCVYGSCDSYKPVSQWDTEQSSTSEDLHKRTVAMYPMHTDTHCKSAHTYRESFQHSV